MRYRRLGKYGVKVSEVALGGWLTHGRTLSDEVTRTVVHGAFDLGVNFFDTADVYNLGEAEKSLAVAIKDLPRRDVFIGTKCFWPMGPSAGPNNRGLSRKHIFESVHGSLERLELDYVDLFQFHRHDPDTPVEESVRAVDDLIRQGKILYWGVSCWTGPQIEEACRVAKEWGCCLPVSNQPPYNMLNREIEAEVIPTSERLGLGQVVFSPLAQGVLTGKYKPGEPPPAGTRAADPNSNSFMADKMEDSVLERVSRLGPIAREAGLTMSQLALAWCLRQKNLSSVIVGATSLEQLAENAVAGTVEVPQSVFDECEKVLQS